MKDIYCYLSFDYNSYDEVKYYEELVVALIDGRLSVEDLIHRSEIDTNDTLRKAILSSSLEGVRIDAQIY